MGTPSQAHRSRLPVLGGTRQHAYLNPDGGASYQASPMARQPLGSGINTENLGSIPLGDKSLRRAGAYADGRPLGR
jgi:hypothetical protein